MATVVQSSPVAFSGAAATTLTATLDDPAAAGNALVFIASGDKDLQPLAADPPTVAGFAQTVFLHTGNVSLILAWVEAAGGETAVSAQLDADASLNLSGSDAVLVEIEETGTGAWTVLGSATSADDGTTVTVKATGATAALARAGLAVGAWAVDSVNTEGTATYTGGWTPRADPSSGAPGGAGLWVATSPVAAGATAGCTLTRTGAAADEMCGAVVVLGRADPAGGDPAGVPLLPADLGPDARLAVEIAWGVDLAADPAGWTWTEVTDDVRQDPGITASLGRSDEASTSQPAQCTAVLDNTSGDYSLGGQSPRWPNVRRNTPVRVRVDPGDGAGWRNVFVGYADGFTPGWDSLTGTTPVVTLSASGTLRRLAQGSAPVMSAYRRKMRDAASVIAYWPMEEGKGATFAPALRGGQDMTFTGEPKWAADSSFDCSRPLPQLGTARLDAPVTPYPATGANTVRFLLAVPDNGLPDGTVLARVWTTGTLGRWDLTYETGGGGWVGFYIYNASGTLRTSVPEIAFQLNGRSSRMSIELAQQGPDVVWDLETIEAVVGSPGGKSTRTITGATVGTVLRVELAPNGDAKDAVIGHLTVEDEINTVYGDHDALVAHIGEYASAGDVTVSRMGRVAAENALAISRYLPPPAPVQLLSVYDQVGPQLVAPLLELLRECEASDQGQLWDGRDAGLSYTIRRYREQGVPALTIDAAAGELDPAFEPVDDDQRNRNKVSAEVLYGVTATYEDATGPLGTATIGVYDSSLTVTNANDVMALHYAAWSVHLGTVEGYRYPAVTVSARATPHQMAAALDLVPGDRIDVVGLDDTLDAFPTGTVSLIVEGLAHTISAADGWTVTAKCSPFSPWGIARAAADTGDTSEFVLRGDTDGSTLTAARPAGATTLSVSTPAGPRWTTAADDYPLTLSVGGIPVVATACTGTGTPQTFTVAPLTHARAAGAPVALHDPRPLGL